MWLVKFFLVTTSFQFPTSLESCCAIKLFFHSWIVWPKVFSSTDRLWKLVTLLFSILVPCNLLTPFSCTSCCHPRAEGAPGTPAAPSLVQGSTLCSSFWLKDSSLKWVFPTAGKDWRNGHSPSPLQSQSPQLSGAELPNPIPPLFWWLLTSVLPALLHIH